jgi:hypothetical protein
MRSDSKAIRLVYSGDTKGAAERANEAVQAAGRGSNRALVAAGAGNCGFRGSGDTADQGACDAVGNAVAGGRNESACALLSVECSLARVDTLTQAAGLRDRGR